VDFGVCHFAMKNHYVAVFISFLKIKKKRTRNTELSRNKDKKTKTKTKKPFKLKFYKTCKV
jgi:hypothetical protein